MLLANKILLGRNKAEFCYDSQQGDHLQNVDVVVCGLVTFKQMRVTKFKVFVTLCLIYILNKLTGVFYKPFTCSVLFWWSSGLGFECQIKSSESPIFGKAEFEIIWGIGKI